MAGRTLGELNLPKVIGAVVTRVRRGDADMIARGDMRLELGDRVRVIARREDLPAAAKFFGDSYRALSEVDVLTFNIGLALGVLAGFVAIPLPGGITLRLGIAGGPLLVSLILGALERSGPLVWGLPYNANLTLLDESGDVDLTKPDGWTQLYASAARAELAVLQVHVLDLDLDQATVLGSVGQRRAGVGRVDVDLDKFVVADDHRRVAQAEHIGAELVKVECAFHDELGTVAIIP